MSGAPRPGGAHDDGTDPVRPWWSSDGPGVGPGVDPDQDPLAAHLAARGLHAVGDDADDHVDEAPDDAADRGGSVGQGAANVGEVRDDGDVPDGGEDAHAPGICAVCPICRGHALVQARHPEVAGHLADAARSLSRALATFADLVDAEPTATPGPGDGSTEAFRTIVLDDEEGGAR